MNVLCAICQDSLEPSNDIFITPCGHVFHFPCLITWLDKAQNCPQCRQTVKRDRITRIFFNFSNVEAVKEDSFTLQQKVDSLSFQIKLKETEFNNIRSENITLKKQNSGLRDEVKRTESKINEKNAAIHALKEQSMLFKSQCQDYDKVKQQSIALQRKLDLYENIKTLICSTSEDVDQLVGRTNDVTTLSTYVAILKRELSSCLDKRKELRNTVKMLQHDLQTMKSSRNTFSEDYIKRIEQLEEALAISNSKKDSLQKRLTALESENRNLDKPVQEASGPLVQTEVSRKREKEMDIDSVIPKKIKRAPRNSKSSFNLKDDFPNNQDSVILVSPDVKKTKENEENSPYLPTKSKSILSINKPAVQHSGWIGPKRTMISSKKSDSMLKSSQTKDSSIVFDGYGGHSKLETFPMPKTSPFKLKRSASDSTKTKKIKLDLSNNKQMDDYIINLT